MSAIIHNINSASRSSNELYRTLLQQITLCLNEELSSMVGHVFDGADDMLFQLAENADSNEDQSSYFDTMRMLRIERSQVCEQFARHIQEYLQLPTENSNQNIDFDEDELSLVDQSEMEELVAISAMHSKAMNLYGEAVNHLEARIEFVSMKSDIFAKDALAPKNICEAFKQALADVELSTRNKLLLYKLFDQEVIVKLAAFYKQLNQIFIDQGILPKIKLGEQPVPAKNQPTSANIENNTHYNDAVYNENPTCDPLSSGSYRNHQFTTSGSSNPQGIHQGNVQGANLQQQVQNVVSQFLHGELTASGPGIPASFTRPASASPSTQYYDRRDVMQAISNIQSGLAHAPAEQQVTSITDFKRSLLEDMGRRSGGAVTKQVSQVDEKTIDFIEMLFDAIVDDDSISEPVTNLLLRLQIPLIKIAMLDEEFFINADHPARTTLNLIAYIGRGISTRDDSLYPALERVVESLLSDLSINSNSFEQAISQLQCIEEAELQFAAEKEKQTQKSVLQAHARDIVLAELQYQVMNKVLPKPCQKLILKHWSTLMFHRYIRFGKNSDEWTDSVSTAKHLIQILQPIQSSQAHHRVESEKDNLLDEIHNTLLQTKQNPVDIETEINHVFITIENMLENSKFNPEHAETSETYYQSLDDDYDLQAAEMDAMPEPDIELIDEEASPLDAQAEQARNKIALLPMDVRPGAWFEVYNGDDSPVRRAKLSVIIMEEAKLVFVDRIGVKVLEKDAEEFSIELEQEKSSMISDHSAFDHALGMVINSLSGTN